MKIAQTNDGMYTSTMRPRHRNICRRLLISLSALLLLISLCSCSFAKPEGAAAGKPADYPDSSLKNATYILGRPDQQPLYIKSQLIEIYQEAKQAHLEQLEFEQLDTDGNILLRGTADRAVIDMDSQDADISGNVFVEKVDDGMLIRCDALTWTDSSQVIETKDGGLVTVTYGDGNSLTGRGFTGYLGEALYEFSTIEEGYILP